MTTSRIFSHLVFGLLIVACAPLLGAQCSAPTCNKIVDNGSDSAKKVIVVMGDGYASSDQTKYNGDVQTLVVDGVLGHDFFREDNNGFNVYRLNLISVD